MRARIPSFAFYLVMGSSVGFGLMWNIGGTSERNSRNEEAAILWLQPAYYSGEFVEGVSELRIHFGPGYRVYFAEVGNHIVLLLIGGTKRRQNADIEKAKDYWRTYAKTN